MLKKFPYYYQLDAKDCAAACLQIISKYYGKYIDLFYLKNQTNITRNGVSLFDLSKAAENIGFKTLSLYATVKELESLIQLPVIINWRQNHYVVVYKIRENKVFISDPALGLISYNRKDFEDNWIPEGALKGACLLLDPSSDFILENVSADHTKKISTTQKIKIYLEPYKQKFIFLIFFLVASSLLQLLLPLISRAVIDVGINSKDFKFINLLLIGNVTIFVGIAFGNYFKSWLMLHISSRLNMSLITDYLHKFLRMPMFYYDTKTYGDILQRIVDQDRIKSFLTTTIISTITSVFTYFIYSSILFYFSWSLFLIFQIGIVLFLAWGYIFLSYTKKLDWRTFELTSRNQSFWVETINLISEIKLNNNETNRQWLWEKNQAKIYNSNLKLLNINQWQEFGSQLINNLKNIGITFYCAYAVIKGDMTLGTMISCQFIIGQVNPAILQIFAFMQTRQSAKISMERLKEIENYELENENRSIFNKQLLPSDKSIYLKNVSFKYNNSNAYVVKNVTFRIPHNQTTAIVGESGSGKTTLLKLLTGLHKPQSGEISLSGIPLTNISTELWRNMCGVVLQDGKLFNDTILKNIIINEDNIDFDYINDLLDILNLKKDIDALPLGINTLIGEHGRNLSGGQKQRILIARALYRKPDVLLFDEATNALDVENEANITEKLFKYFQNKTVVIIAHRLSTIIKADQIIVMNAGMIVEIGKHEQLLLKKGKYSKLMSFQNSIS